MRTTTRPPSPRPPKPRPSQRRSPLRLSPRLRRWRRRAPRMRPPRRCSPPANPRRQRRRPRRHPVFRHRRPPSPRRLPCRPGRRGHVFLPPSDSFPKWFRRDPRQPAATDSAVSLRAARLFPRAPGTLHAWALCLREPHPRPRAQPVARPRRGRPGLRPPVAPRRQRTANPVAPAPRGSTFRLRRRGRNRICRRCRRRFSSRNR